MILFPYLSCKWLTNLLSFSTNIKSFGFFSKIFSVRFPVPGPTSKTISSLLILEKSPKEILLNYSKRPQANIAVSVNNKDIVNDASIQSAINDAQSDITVDRLLVRPSGTENKIRVMVEAPDKKTATKYAKDISKLIQSKI